MRIGILALQGAFAEHAAMLDRLGIEHFDIRQAKDLDNGINGLILPGGESTTMHKLLHNLNLYTPLLEHINNGMPVFGTCAGLLLLAHTVDGGTPCFGTMNICAKRNAYGRQLGSFFTRSTFKGIGNVPMDFIRAPYIADAGNGVDVLATVEHRIVAAQQNNMLVTAFHPELCDDTAIHRYFIEMVQASF